MALKVFAFALVSSLAVAALGCGSGLSTDDATLRCNQEREAKSACVTQTAFDACVQCYEECGDTCSVLETCPAQYSCPQ